MAVLVLKGRCSWGFPNLSNGAGLNTWGVSGLLVLPIAGFTGGNSWGLAPVYQHPGVIKSQKTQLGLHRYLHGSAEIVSRHLLPPPLVFHVLV